MKRLVALEIEAGHDYLSELRRILEAGDAVLPVDMRLGLPARRRLLEAMRPAAVLAATGEESSLDGALPVEEGDALVIPTSGTTGEPKGVVLTARAVVASALASSARLAVDPACDRWWACLPFAHIGGLAVALRSMVTCLPCHVSQFSPELAAAALSAGSTLTSLVPTALARLPAELASGFRLILLGGQSPPPSLPYNVVTTYGMSETGSGVVYDGRPLPGVEVAIDPQSSEVLLRGPMLLRSYRDGIDPKTDDGWLPTGDVGEVAADGRLVVRGRIGELVITGGENVWPSAVEPVLERHPAVKRAAVAGRSDPEWGQRVTAYLVVEGPVEAAELLGELRDLVQEELASFAAPREIVVVDQLPLTRLGKVLREQLHSLDGPSASL